MKEQYFHSTSHRGFYLQSIKEPYKKSTIGQPDYAVEITEAKYNSLLEGQGSSKEITPDANGKLVLADPVVVAEGTKRQLLAEAEEIITH